MQSPNKFARHIVMVCLVSVVGLTAYGYFSHGELNWIPLLPVLIAAGVVFGYFEDAEKKDGGDAR